MRRSLLALALLGCGEGGGGGAAAPSEAPLCDPPELTCEQPQRHDGAGDRYQEACGDTDEDFTLVDRIGDRVISYQRPVGIAATCWPGGPVAVLDQPETPTACYDQDGRRADCDQVQDALGPAWGLTPPNP